MANYYTQFSILLEDIPEEDYPYLRGLVKRVEEAEKEDPIDDELFFECKLTEDEGSLWIYANEGDPEDAAEVLRLYFADRQPERVEALYWANSCSKPWPDSFSGGACVITAKEIFWFNLDQQVGEKLDKLSLARSTHEKV